ncbi:MAG TPA: cation transporter dimerization domain-containing protein, partial [Actinomycetota bacterium]|nr:cation transporter dimerization domain-containing protein [Actinomycetota bacterium]
DVLARLLDRVDPEVVDAIERAAASVPGAGEAHAVRARWLGRSLHVLVHVPVDPELPLGEAHALGERVRHRIFHSQPGVAEVDVHLDPAGTDVHASHAETLHHVAATHRDHDDHDHEGDGPEPARRVRAPAARQGGGGGADRAGGQAGAPPGRAGGPR